MTQAMPQTMKQRLMFSIRHMMGVLGLSDIALSLRNIATPGGRLVRKKMLRMYSQFVRDGDLCFDVGAHYGNRVEIFLKLGATVVAIEPQPRCQRYLYFRYGKNPQVTLISKGLDDRDGQRQLYLNPESSMSSMSEEHIAHIKRRPMFAHDRWDKVIQVSVATFDSLIAAYGVPVFAKIDVEGFEDRVLNGLSQPLQSLSIEYTPERISTALTCLDRLSSLGLYEFNYSVSETMEFALSNWVNAEQMKGILNSLVASDCGGDLYARRVQGDSRGS